MVSVLNQNHRELHHPSFTHWTPEQRECSNAGRTPSGIGAAYQADATFIGSLFQKYSRACHPVVNKV